MIDEAFARSLGRCNQLTVISLRQDHDCRLSAPSHMLRLARQCVGYNRAEAVLGIPKVSHGPISCLDR